MKGSTTREYTRKELPSKRGTPEGRGTDPGLAGALVNSRDRARHRGPSAGLHRCGGCPEESGSQQLQGRPLHRCPGREAGSHRIAVALVRRRMLRSARPLAIASGSGSLCSRISTRSASAKYRWYCWTRARVSDRLTWRDQRAAEQLGQRQVEHARGRRRGSRPRAACPRSSPMPST